MKLLAKVVAAIVLVPIVILVVGFGGCEARKAYYDSQVRKLCERDGGVVVFEPMPISRELFARLGGSELQMIRVPSEKEAPEVPFFREHSSTDIRAANPHIFRFEMRYYRRSDRKLLAVRRSYSRVGGDFPTGIAHPSSVSCPPLEHALPALKSIFPIREQ
jgi:hypothetical protein